jgi:DNA polymerase
MDVRAAIRAWARHADQAYGGDLPIRALGALRVPVPATEGVTASPGGAPPTPRATSPVGHGAETAHDDPVETAPPEVDLDRLDLPEDLGSLRRIVTTCRKCKLCDHRTQTVFGEGAADARVLFVGEAPGAREDRLGHQRTAGRQGR